MTRARIRTCCVGAEPVIDPCDALIQKQGHHFAVRANRRRINLWWLGRWAASCVGGENQSDVEGFQRKWESRKANGGANDMA
jgi:hypothetical protein